MAWPAHNYDLSNTRATTNSRHQRDQRREAEARLAVQAPVRRPVRGIRLEPDRPERRRLHPGPDSDVYALNQQTGAVMWKHLYKSPTPSGGPNGLALGYGMLFGATEASAFALDAKTGKQLWMHKLTDNKNEGIDMAPQLYDNKVLISTIPGSATNFYHPGAPGDRLLPERRHREDDLEVQHHQGRLQALRPSRGEQRRRPLVPTVGRQQRTRLHGRRQPGALPRHAQVPERLEPSGANLYTDSLVALDGADRQDRSGSSR